MRAGSHRSLTALPLTALPLTLAALAVGALAPGCASASQAKAVPAGWAMVAAGPVSLSGPPDLTAPGGAATGEHQSWQNTDLAVFVTWGAEATAPAGRAQEVERGTTSVDGEHVELLHFATVAEGVLPPGAADKGNWAVATLAPIPPRTDPGHTPAVVWVSYADPAQRATADQMLGSLHVVH